MGRALLCSSLCSLATMSIAASAPRMEDFAGLWQPTQKVTALRPTDGKLPALQPRARKLFDAAVASAADGDRWFDNELDCLPLGMTRLMAESPFELVVSATHVALVFEWNRHVHFAERSAKHAPAYDYPAYLGHTTANLRGTALQLDSVYFTDDTLLDSSGLPHSDKLQVQQSLQLRDANTLVNTLTITDPATFATPWKATLTYGRLPAGAMLKEDVCVERMGLQKLNAHQRRDAGLKQLGL
jgi:hypothetical protein